MSRFYQTPRGRVSNRGDLPRFVGLFPCAKADGGVLVFTSISELRVAEYLAWSPEVISIAFEAGTTGTRQINSTFALTYKNKKVSREGVEVGHFKYNSDELNELYRISDARVDVKINPDDVRTAVVHHRELPEPVEVELTTHALPEPTSWELAKELLGPAAGAEDDGTAAGTSASDRFLAKLHDLQTGGRRGRPRRANADADAAVHAAALPPVAPPTPKTIDNAEFDALFDGDDCAAD